MQKIPIVINTDGITLQNIRIPANELIRSEELIHLKALKDNLNFGIPAGIQHDRHRLYGWHNLNGLYINKDMVSHVSILNVPENEREQSLVNKWNESFYQADQDEQTKPYKAELLRRIDNANLESKNFTSCEAATVCKEGIAADIYPEYFSANQQYVDKDGLVNYNFLLENLELKQPGVFYDPKRNLLLFAHRSFRKNHSHLNKLNTYFLENFHSIFENHSKELSARIKLDPDMLGHPDSLKSVVELEYWHGPKFDNDISKIPNGVTVHKADKDALFYEQIDQTHCWWKSPETRTTSDEKIQKYRTFEIEELLDAPSHGLGENIYGCRYSHAEYSLGEEKITHFDGAIRAYQEDAYLKRMDTQFNKAGKQSQYLKLFRFDGEMDLVTWKELLCNFFKGNKLVPEYLGTPIENKSKSNSIDVTEDDKVKVNTEIELATFVHLAAGSVSNGINLYSLNYLEFNNEPLHFVEIGSGRTAKFINKLINLDERVVAEFNDGILNISPICIGGDLDIDQVFNNDLHELSKALMSDYKKKPKFQISVPIFWGIGKLVCCLTIAGEAKKVSETFSELGNIIEPKKLPSSWVQNISDYIQEKCSKKCAPVNLEGVECGVLEIKRVMDTEIKMKIPEKLKHLFEQSNEQ